MNVEVINCGCRARTANTLIRDFLEHVELKRPDVVVVHVGLVDGAPRIISLRERSLLAHCPTWIRNRIIRRRASRRAQILRKDPLARVYVRPDDFTRCLRRFGEKLSDLDCKPRLIVLPILYDAEKMEAKSPGFVSNMEIYSKALSDFAAETNAQMPTTADIYASDRSDMFCSDGMHLKETGAEAVARTLRAVIEKNKSPI
jgi:lysophospholipase L1-like esterase